ncbi:MAG: uroporphyrinogen-III synthase [Planctomycetota bacterium]|jgi:uroporphyrinogen-III synthase
MERAISGRRVIVTRAESEDSGFEDALKNSGLSVERISLIEFARPANWQVVMASVESLSEFDWLIFSSPRAVEFTIQAGASGEGVAVACVGESTAQKARDAGFDVKLVGQAGGAELADELAKSGPAKALVPCGNLAVGELQQRLMDNGWHVREVVVYENVANKAGQVQLAATIEASDATVFHSGSAVRSALEAVTAEQISTTRVYSFGPSATDALDEAGIAVTLEAAKPDNLAFAESIIEFERQLG